MKRGLLSTIFLLTLIPWAYTQQLPYFTQYTEYQGIINPAAQSYEGFMTNFKYSVGTSIREQWAGIPASPKTQLIRGDFKLNSPGKFDGLVGLFLVNDKAGYISSTGIYGRLASLYESGNSWGNRKNELGFSVGLLGGVVQYRVDTKGLREIDNNNDPNLDNEVNIIRPELGLGAQFYSFIYRNGRAADILTLGLSIPQLIAPTIELGSGDGESYAIDKVPHYYVTASYFFDIGPFTYLELSTWTRWVKHVSPSLDFMCRYRFAHYMWVGAGMNSFRHFNAEIGVSFDDLIGIDSRTKLAFSYNPIGPDFTAQFGNSFELNLSYFFDSK